MRGKRHYDGCPSLFFFLVMISLLIQIATKNEQFFRCVCIYIALLVIIDRIAIFYIYDLDCNSSKASANTLFHIDVASGN